jgi:uncharacterized protein
MSAGLAGLALLLGGCERSLLYFPQTAREDQLLTQARTIGLTPWRDAAGALIGWHRPATGPATERRTVVIFHGNAGQALQRDYFVQGFGALPGGDAWDVFIFEYPGYGARPGRPSETAIKDAAAQALGLLSADEHPRLFLVGESLGSGVACHLAGEQPDRIAGLLLITPFTKLEDLARQHYPGWVVRVLLSESYDNVGALARYRGPVAVLLAELDEIIPAEIGRRLYEGYSGRKKLWVQAGRTHNTLWLGSYEPWWAELNAFWHEFSL